MKKIKHILFVIGIAAILYSPMAFAQDIGLKVSSVEGGVKVKISPAIEWTDANIDQVISAGDSVKVGKDGKALLELSDKSTIALNSNTEVSVEELAWGSDGRKAILNMPAGELRAFIMKVGMPSEFLVKTPLATSRATGTVFYVLATETQTRVFVTEGAVDFTNLISGNTYIVVQNMIAISEISGSVSEPREITGEEREQILAGWSGIVAETYTEPENQGIQGGGNDTVNFESPNIVFENAAQENKGQQEQKASPI